MSDCSPLRLPENGQSSSESSEDPVTGRNQTTSDSSNRQSAQGRARRTRTQSDSSSKSVQLRYGAKNVIELFIPVSLCMLIVVATMKATDRYRYSSQEIIWYAQMMFTDQSVDTGTRVIQSFANALILLVCIMVMTTILILLYKFRCYATIHGWLILGSLVLLFMFALMYVAEILKVYNIAMDVYTLSVFIWNFGVVGMICIHWKGPLLLQQGYLILISALMALVLIRSLPDWTIWTVLAIVSVWDMIAVLCPRGPLRILVETAQERNESIFPALIYSSAMMWETISMADNPSTSNKSESSEKRRSGGNQEDSGTSSRAKPSKRKAKGQLRTSHPVEIHYEDGVEPPEVAFVQPSGSVQGDDNSRQWRKPHVRAVERKEENDNGHRQTRNNRASGDDRVVRGTEVTGAANSGDLAINCENARDQQQCYEEEERGVKLGLGDFIFFSVLVGKASSYGDWTITMACYIAILVGLCLTLSLLAIFRKALPALPISIAFGLSTFFLSYAFVMPFADQLTMNQVFI